MLRQAFLTMKQHKQLIPKVKIEIPSYHRKAGESLMVERF